LAQMQSIVLQLYFSCVFVAASIVDGGNKGVWKHILAVKNQ